MGTSALDSALPDAFAVARAALSGFPDDVDVSALPGPLQDALYRDWYCAAGSKPDVHGDTRDLAELLRAAHAGTDRWENGWRVAKVSSRGRIAAVRGRERRVVHIIDCLPPESAGAEIRPGDEVSVVARRCSESINPGDWVTFTQNWHAHRKQPLRVYWNTTGAGAVRLVQELTRALDDGIPFFLKCPRRPSEYDRRDAVVLYLPPNRFDEAAPMIAHTASVAVDMLRDPVAPLTKRISKGVSLAEDPAADDHSFGTSRCALIAKGIAACFAEGRKDDACWLEAVRRAFASEGIPAERPWVGTTSSPEYSLP